VANVSPTLSDVGRNRVLFDLALGVTIATETSSTSLNAVPAASQVRANASWAASLLKSTLYGKRRSAAARWGPGLR
jgi:hypothetical protein